MQLVMRSFLFFTVLFVAGSCGGKKHDGKTAQDEKKQAGQVSEEKVAIARAEISDFLGAQLTEHIKYLSEEISRDLGRRLSDNGRVSAEASRMTKAVMEAPEVKFKLDKIADDATGGVGKKLSLGFKALTSGGVSSYKKKVKERTQKIAIAALAAHLKDNILKDERSADLFKAFGPSLKLSATVSAMSLQENLSPRVTQKILDISLRIAAQTDKHEIASKVEDWISDCQRDSEREVERLLRGIARLDSFERSVEGLAVEILGHERTRAELTAATLTLIGNREVNSMLVKLYEDAAFEKSGSVLESDIKTILAHPDVDRELYATMERLLGAPGAPGILSKHAAVVTEDPRLAEMLEDFVLNVLEVCGDPNLAS